MPTTITGTDGVSQVQTGAVESGDLAAGAIGSGDLPSGTIVGIANDSITVNGTRTSNTTYTSSTVITPPDDFSRLYVYFEVSNLSGGDAYGTFGTYIAMATPSLTLSDVSELLNSPARHGNNNGNNSTSSYISSSASSSGLLYVEKNTGNWTTSDTFSFRYRTNVLYSGHYYGIFSILFFFTR